MKRGENMIAIVDYGVGNLFSLSCSLAAINADTVVTSDADIIRGAEKIILPGVGAFCDAANKLRECGLAEVVCEQAALGKPILGICLGMQLLFDKSFEFGEHKGLGLIKGEVRDLKDAVKGDLKIPHMGWNALNLKQKDHPLFKYIKDGDHVYFVHSFHAVECDDAVIATSEYSLNVTAAVANKNVMGFQFHPEKSGNVGLKLLKAFCEM